MPRRQPARRRLLRRVLPAAVALGAALAPCGAAHAASGDYAFQVRAGTQRFSFTLPSMSVATFKWAPGSARARAWLTSPAPSGRGLRRTLEAATPAFGAAANGTPLVDVDPSATYQSIDGFGGAMTDSSAALIAGSPRRDEIMRALFGADGARFSLTRLPMGGTDFVADPAWQSYDDMPAGQTDPALAHFSIAHDTAYTIPLLRQARELSPSLKLLATPWSAPGWMKFGGSFFGSCGGNASFLRNEFYPAYARYFVKFAQQYAAGHGVPIDMFSLQNEPSTCKPGIPTMQMSPGDQASFAAVLRGELDAAGFGATRLLAWDDNWRDGLGRPATAAQQSIGCSGASASSPIDAVGYHAYAGHDVLAQVQDAFHAACPGKDIYFTEGTDFDGAPNTRENLVWAMRNALIGPLRHWARGSTYWNLALDERGGPNRNGCAGCRGMITVRSDGSFALDESYVFWAHFSKFVDPGAVRIDSTDLGPASIESVAFRNPDGSIVLVALHGSSSSRSPSNAFTIAGRRVDGRGRIRLTLRSPGAGRFSAVATARRGRATIGFARRSASTRKRATVTLTLAPGAGARRDLRRRDLRVSVAVSFRPTGGASRTRRVQVTVRRLAGR